MPTILFLISLIIASSMFLTINQVVRDNAVNRALIESGAAFYTADSKGESLELNQGVESNLIHEELSFREESFVEPFFRSGLEVFLEAGEDVDAVLVDYCGKEELDCPEIFVEWFRLGEWFRFHSLAELKEKKTDLDEIDHCLDLPEIKVRRCVVGSWEGSGEPLSFRDSEDEGFRKSFKLNVDSSYQYLLRFWSKEGELFEFSIAGLKDDQKLPLQGFLEETDRLARAGNSHRRIKRQDWLSGGLQDGLNFVHYAGELADK